MYNGLICVYKEPGFTSFDVVAKLRGILKQKKIGHTGTLDPQAEGVLLVCLGSGTKLVNMLEDRSKEYRCKMLLGVETDTEDTTGTILNTKDVTVSEEMVTEACLSFIGDYAQIPPMYSALKVNGKKLYELARQGEVIERKARNIYIHDLNIEDISLPYVTFTVSCSKGTYIRSLCRDIGAKLGCGATMEHLTRTRVGHFDISNAKTLDEIEQYRDNETIDDYIVSIEDIFSELDSVHVNNDSARFIDNGNPLTLSNMCEINITPENDKLYRVYNSQGLFCAVYKYNSDNHLFMPEKMFSTKV